MTAISKGINSQVNAINSDSDTDGNFSDTGSYLGGGGRGILVDGQAAPNIDDISEHSSDEADSDSEEVNENGQPTGKKKGEKSGNPDKPKRKKKRNAEKNE